jgi:hypothetical protein
MATNAEVPARYDVGLNGRAYMVDWTMRDRMAGPVSLKVNRTQQDTSHKAGEASLARENLWRRTHTAWHHGAGQQTYDDEVGDPYRFRKSRGIDVFTTPGQAKPVGGLSRIPVPSANGGHIVWSGWTQGQMMVFNGLPYVVGNTQGRNVYNCWDPSTSATNVPNGVAAMCNDGVTTYIADTGGVIYTSPLAGAAATAGLAATSYYLVAFVLGRLWGAEATGLFNVTNVTTGARTPAFALSTAIGIVNGVAQGTGGVLVAVQTNGKSLVYFVGLLPDGSGITPGYPIAELPEGEDLTGIFSYLGYVLLGTNKGVHVCQHHGGANFTVGPLIDTFSAQANLGIAAPPGSGVRCFAAFDRFVYFGWEFYDWGGQSGSVGTSGTAYFGLGRIDLSTPLGPLQPAYCADTMRKIVNTDNHTTGAVVGCAVDKNGTPWFVVNNDELYGGSIGGTPNKSSYSRNTCEDPYLYMGKTILGLDDLKLPAALSVRTSTDGGTGGGVTVAVVREDGTSTSAFTTSPTVGTTTADLSTIPLTESLEVRMTWSSLLDSFTPQTIYDARIDAWPSPRRLERWQIPLLLRTQVATKDDTVGVLSPTTELNAIRALSAPSGRAIVDFQFLGQTYQVVVDDYEFVADQNEPVVDGEYQGTVIVTLSRAVT